MVLPLPHLTFCQDFFFFFFFFFFQFYYLIKSRSHNKEISRTHYRIQLTQNHSYFILFQTGKLKKNKNPHFKESVSLSRPPNPRIYAISLSQSQTQQLNPMIPVQAICYLRRVSCCQFPSAKAVEDFSRLRHPQIILHSRVSVGLKSSRTLTTILKKGMKKRNQQKVPNQSWISYFRFFCHSSE